MLFGHNIVDVLPGLKAGASTPPDGSAVAPQGPPPFLPALKDGVSRRISMSCKSALCLRCAKVHGDNWVSQVSQALHAGVIYRHIILTVPAMFRTPLYQN